MALLRKRKDPVDQTPASTGSRSPDPGDPRLCPELLERLARLGEEHPGLGLAASRKQPFTVLETDDGEMEGHGQIGEAWSSRA